MKIDNLKPGMIATFQYEGPVTKMKKRGNPLAGRVTKKSRLVCNVAGKQTYERTLAKQGKEKAGGTSYWKWHPTMDGIGVHKTNGTQYVVVTGPSQRETHYFVDGRPATEEELKTIHEFLPKSGEKPAIMVMSVDKLQNLS